MTSEDRTRDDVSSGEVPIAGTEESPAAYPWWGEPWGEDAASSATTVGTPAGSSAADPESSHNPLPYMSIGSAPQRQWVEGNPTGRRILAALAIAVGVVLFTSLGAAIGVHVGERHPVNGAAVTLNKGGSTTSAPVINGDGSTTIEAVAAAVQPAVVSITETTSQVQGEGSGVVIDAEHGYILTNNHVVSSVATSGGKLVVTTSDGRKATATIVGRDPTSDIAVIRVQLNGLTQAQLGDSTTLKVGQTVVAFGSPLGLQGTVTSGIVSALNRPVSTQDTPDSNTSTQATIDAIQTDAAINPGNSGGALVDGGGKVIGINSAIASTGSTQGESGNIGVGFAIPINEAIKVAQQIIQTGHAVHPVVGASISDSTGDTAGALIRQITANGPAAQAGLRVGDLITQVDETRVPDADSAIVALRRNHDPGDKVKLTYVRDGATKAATVTLAASAPSP